VPAGLADGVVLGGDGSRQHNSDRSQGPLGKRGARLSNSGTWTRGTAWTQSQANVPQPKCAKGGRKLIGCARMPGAGLTDPPFRKVPSERLALKPYWEKPAVRDFREGDGNVSHGRTMNPLHGSKEWMPETLCLTLRAPSLYPTSATPPRLEHGLLWPWWSDSTQTVSGKPGAIQSVEYKNA